MCLSVGAGWGWMGSCRGGIAVVPSAGCRGHGPVGVDFQEMAEFLWGGKGIAWLGNRGRLWGSIGLPNSTVGVPEAGVASLLAGVRRVSVLRAAIRSLVT